MEKRRIVQAEPCTRARTNGQNKLKRVLGCMPVHERRSDLFRRHENGRSIEEDRLRSHWAKSKSCEASTQLGNRAAAQTWRQGMDRAVQFLWCRLWLARKGAPRVTIGICGAAAGTNHEGCGRLAFDGLARLNMKTSTMFRGKVRECSRTSFW